MYTDETWATKFVHLSLRGDGAGAGRYLATVISGSTARPTFRTAKRKIWHLFLGESRRKLRAIGIESWWGSQKPAHSSLVTSAF